MEATTDTPLWTKREVAAYLGVGVRTVERLRIPRVAMPARGSKPIVRYDPAEVKAFVDRSRSRASARKAG